MREYRPKVKCTGPCIEEYCPVCSLGYGGKIIEKVLGEHTTPTEKRKDKTFVYNADGTIVTITLFGDQKPGRCGFRIRTEGPYEKELLEKLKKEIFDNLPRIEITESNHRHPYRKKQQK